MPQRPGQNFIASQKKKVSKEYNRSRPHVHEFYSSPEWKKLRSAYRNAHPLCEECLRQGRTTAAQMVDHVKEIEDGGDRLDWNNLQSLCFSCHNRKTALLRGKHQWGGGYQKSERFGTGDGGDL